MINHGEILKRSVLFLIPALILSWLAVSFIPARIILADNKVAPEQNSKVIAAGSADVIKAAGGVKRIVCSLPDQRLYFFEGDQLVNIMRCSTGVNDSTPIGEYHILNHHLTHGVIWGEVCDYWLGFTSSHGIHSWPRKAAGDLESELGSPASPGCIVLHPMEAGWPYYWAPDGTLLTVTRASLYNRVISGCHSSAGTTSLSREWFFAEGYTAEGFDTYLLMANPGEDAIDASVSFLLEGGTTLEQACRIEPHSRYTLAVDAVPQLGSAAFSMHVHADGPVVAERAMYFSKGYITGGHACEGATQPSRNWSFAEGCTRDLFETYLLVGNPGDDDAVVYVDFYMPEGSLEYGYMVRARSRVTIPVNAQPGLEGKDVTFSLCASSPVVAERAVYYDLDSRRGGHAALGVTAASGEWYFAEGYTDGAFDTYILLSNPGFEDADVELSFCNEDGSWSAFAYVVPAQRRLTVHVDELPGMERCAFSTRIRGNAPVVAERAVYFVIGRE
jgi:hypothetical protein